MKRRILVAYDGSDLSQEALQEAELQATSVPDTEVFVLSVVTQSGPITNTGIARNIESEIAEDLRTKLQKVLEDFTAEDTTVFTEVVTDNTQRNAGKKISEYAKEHDIDLIIVGSRGLGGVQRVLLGSVSTQVVQYAECRVLVIK